MRWLAWVIWVYQQGSPNLSTPDNSSDRHAECLGHQKTPVLFEELALWLASWLRTQAEWLRLEVVAQIHAGAPIASWRGFIKTSVAIIDDDRTHILAIEQVVNTSKGVERPGSQVFGVAHTR